MAIEITMPKLSDTMEEGKIIKWLVSEGDQINSGDVIAEIETDKADMEYEVIEDGVLLKIVAAEGDSAPVGQIIAYIGEEGEEIEGEESRDEAQPAEDVQSSDDVEEEPEAEIKEEDNEITTDEPVEETEEDADDADSERDQADQAIEEKAPATGGVKASPVARKLAEEAGLDISTIEGSGPDGRVIKRDIEKALGKSSDVPPTQISEPDKTSIKEETDEAKPGKETIEKPVPEDVKLAGTREPMSGMRKTIAKRLVESKVTVPHFYLTVEVDMGPVMQARKTINEAEGIKLSVNDFIIKASAKALQEHNYVNAHIEGDEIVFHDTVDIGVAVALEEGLITPYVRNAVNKGLREISDEVGDLAERARNRKLKPEEYSGGSFTISNLGMFGIDHFTAIINPPESTILAVGTAKEMPVVIEGKLAVGWRMKMTLSCDHRIVDGAVGARFMTTLRDILEHPMRMLV